MAVAAGNSSVLVDAGSFSGLHVFSFRAASSSARGDTAVDAMVVEIGDFDEEFTFSESDVVVGEVERLCGLDFATVADLPQSEAVTTTTRFAIPPPTALSLRANV